MTPYEIAKQEIGVNEKDNSARIVEYDSHTSLKATDDKIPWCSAFMNWCVSKAGLTGTNSAAAMSWVMWGDLTEDPKEGDIIIIQRGQYPSAHVGFFAEKQPGLIKILGGNQKDCVEYDWFKDNGVIGYRKIPLVKS